MNSIRQCDCDDQHAEDCKNRGLETHSCPCPCHRAGPKPAPRADPVRVLGTSEDPDRPAKMADVIEIPRGEYDAKRTLRHLLQLAEKGEIVRVVAICAEPSEESEEGEMLWASWSDMTRVDILWMTRWFDSFINHRYFGQHHDNPIGGDGLSG